MSVAELPILQEKITRLRTANADIKKYLKNLNLELASLPTPLLETLNNYARIKNDTELHSLDTSYLDEFYLLKKKEKLHNSEIIADLTLTINQFHDETKRDREQLDILEKFLQVHSTKSHEDIENERLAIEQKIAGVDAAYEQTFNQELVVDLDSIIEKLLELQK